MGAEYPFVPYYLVPDEEGVTPLDRALEDIKGILGALHTLILTRTEQEKQAS